MAKSLQQENDILRFQLNDLINREKNQVNNLFFISRSIFIVQCNFRFSLLSDWKLSTERCSYLFYVSMYQRLELQRLRAHRDVEVSALVNASTQKLKGEIERVKGLLEPASSSLAQAIADKDKVVAEKEELMAELAKMRNTIEEDSTTHGGRLRNLESIMQRSSVMANNILKSVEAFQRHVLPNFKVVNTKINKCYTSDPDGPNKIIDDVRI
jgi:hypothetical protein